MRDFVSVGSRGIGESSRITLGDTEGDSGGAERIALETRAGVRELQQPQGGGAAIVLSDLAEARIPAKSWRSRVCHGAQLQRSDEMRGGTAAGRPSDAA